MFGFNPVPGFSFAFLITSIPCLNKSSLLFFFLFVSTLTFGALMLVLVLLPLPPPKASLYAPTPRPALRAVLPI